MSGRARLVQIYFSWRPILPEPVPEDLYHRAADIAAAEKISVDELFASAFEERLLEFERLKDKAAQGSYDNSGAPCQRSRRANPAITIASDPPNFYPEEIRL